ncbi:MAG: multicopper oxidase domain-containing protein [Thermoanaerobaculia bacterium]
MTIRGGFRRACALLAVVLPSLLSAAQTAPETAPARQDFDVLHLMQTVKPGQEQGRTVWSYELVVRDGELRLADGTGYKVWGYSGQVPGPTLLAREGDWVRIRLINETSVPHTVHSHGLFVPNRMDGVPHALGMEAHDASHGHGGAALPDWTQPVQPGESYVYEYIARPAGTHFYHCHMNTNEHLARGMSGALIVLPRGGEPAVQQDRVLLLDEWNSRYARGGTPGAPRELNDEDFFTLNGKSFPETEPILAAIGDVVRLRLINAGSQSHSMHLHGHTFLVTHKDGRPLAEPVEMDTVPIAPGERIDLLIVADNPGTWCFHCHTPAHVTNAGRYPGGMLMHLQVGPDPFPERGDGPVRRAVTLETLRETWKRSRQETISSQR